jgi:hypothetical protein
MIDWDTIRAEWGPDAPGWKLIPHDWLWCGFWLALAYIVAVAIAGTVFWVEWMFSGEDRT